MPPRSARSVSNDSYGLVSDDEKEGQPCAAPKKPGKDGNSKDVDQRKEQNRVAQREFRQRKQQYIKGLEARLALHEASRDDQLEQMRTGIRALLDENHRLRELLASVSGFIGEGLGGVLPRLGVENAEFQELITRSRTDHVFRVLDALKEEQSKRKNGSAGPSNPKRARTSDTASPRDPPLPTASTSAASTSANQGYSYTPPGAHDLSAPSTSLNLDQTFQTLPSPHVPQQFPQYANHASLANFGPLPPPPPSMPGHSLQVAAAATGVQPVVDPDENKEAEFRNLVRSLGATVPIEEHDDTIQELFSMPTDNPKLQAIQLISYHMRNKREQPGYHLPPSLRATVTQQSVPHSSFFDGIIFASLRDRLILLKDQYDLGALLGDLIDAFAIHEDDILLPANWELSEAFIRKYWYVIDNEVLGISNRWRRERGEPELSLREIVPDGADIAAEGTLGKKRDA